MSKTIKTYNDLCEERTRLKSLLVVQKQRMKDDWDGLKHELNPMKKAAGVFGKMARPDKSNPLINKGVKVATDIFITKFVLGKAGWLTKAVVPLVLSNYSTHVIADKGKNFISRLATFLNNKKKYGIREHVKSSSVTPVSTAMRTATDVRRDSSASDSTTSSTSAASTAINIDTGRNIVAGQDMMNRDINDDLRQAARNEDIK